MSDSRPPDTGIIREIAGILGKRIKDRAAAKALRDLSSGERADAAPPPETEGADEVPGERQDPLVLQALSLLWPPEQKGGSPSAILPEQTAIDLEIPYLVSQIAPKRRHAPALDRALRTLLTEEETIRYRHDIVSDILGCPELRECCRKLAEQWVATSESFRVSSEARPKLFLVAMRLAELEDFADTVDALRGALAAAPVLKSSGLLRLKTVLDAVGGSRRYAHLRATVSRLVRDPRDVRSVTVGINLDRYLRPVEATLVSINRRRFVGSRLLSTLFGRDRDGPNRGIADLHSMLAQRPQDALPVATPLFRDLGAILEQLGGVTEKELREFSGASVDFVVTLKQELVFYASAVNLVERLEGMGLPVCRPTMVPGEERETVLREGYNVNLAFRMRERGIDPRQRLVRNDAVLRRPFRLAVLTGPNSGGKSVFLQALGLAQVLAQAGMHVPAASADLSVADTILTHYQSEERPDKEVGRLQEEASRLRDLLAGLTRQSLLLSSETFSSTGSSEAAYLLSDVIRALQKLGGRAVFSTHLHELAELVERDPAFRTGETQVANLVALFEEEADGGEHAGKPTYRIVTAKPQGRSFAASVARALGIQYDQLLESLARSGRLPRESTGGPPSAGGGREGQ